MLLYVGFLLSLLCRYTDFFPKALLSYWALSTVLEVIKVVRLATYNQLHPAKGTAYPSSDWLLDNAVMVNIYMLSLHICLTLFS